MDIPKDTATLKIHVYNNKLSDRDSLLSRSRNQRLIVFYETEFYIQQSDGKCFQFPDKLRPKSDKRVRAKRVRAKRKRF